MWRKAISERRATLVMSEEQFKQFRSQLLKDDGLERAAFLFLGRHELGDRLELYAHRMMTPADSDYRQQHGTVVEPGPEYVLETFAAFNRCETPVYLHAHSHPFSTQASFSGIDERYRPGEVESLKQYVSLADNTVNAQYARLVYGRDETGFTADCLDLAGAPVAVIDAIRIVGSNGLRTLTSGSIKTAAASDAQALAGERLDRNIRWLGEEGQMRLCRTHLVICGLGGIGSALVANASGLGFRRLTLVDPDRVEPSNLNRLFGAVRKDVGQQKVEVMARQLKRIDPETEVYTVAKPLNDAAAREAIVRGDLIICGLDSIEARLDAQILAARHLKPLLDLGSGIILEGSSRRVAQMGAQASFYIPGGPCLLCQGLDPSRIISAEHREMRRAIGYVEGTDETPPSVITINSIIAGIGMDLVVKYLTGFAAYPAYLRYDLLSHATHEYSFDKRQECPVCGEDGVEGKGSDESQILIPEDLRAGTRSINKPG